MLTLYVNPENYSVVSKPKKKASNFHYITNYNIKDDIVADGNSIILMLALFE